MINGFKCVQDILDFPDPKVIVRYSESVWDYDIILGVMYRLVKQYGNTKEKWELFSDEIMKNLWEEYKIPRVPFYSLDRHAWCLDANVFITVGPIPEKAMNWLLFAFKDHGKRWIHFRSDKTLNHGTVVIDSWISSEKPCF